MFEGASDAETELKLCSSAYIYVQLRGDLWRHTLRGDSGGVVAGR